MDSKTLQTLRRDAEDICRSAIEASVPDAAIQRALAQLPPCQGRTVLVSIGKAGWQTAKAAYDALGSTIEHGVVVTKYGHSQGPIGDLAIYEAGHPVPDEHSVRATEAALAAVSGLSARDRVLFLVSGGGSALFERPLVPLAELEDITGQKINHVAMVRFGGLVKVVDALGGVDLCYDQNVNDPYSGMNWTAGCHTVDGNTALAFSRMRYADVQGDFGRAARQRQVINAIVKKGASKQTLTNFNKTKKVAAAALSSVTVDEKASTSSLLRMALAFKSASGKDGISGSVYWTDPDYYVDGVGSCVLLDDAKNIQLFSELSHGTHSAGTVGTLAEQQN